jgi:hypothetical protein
MAPDDYLDAHIHVRTTHLLVDKFQLTTLRDHRPCWPFS